MSREQDRRRFASIQRLDRRDMVATTVETVKRYLADYPSHGPTWLYYTDSLYAMARYAEALSALRRASRLCPPRYLHLVYCRFGHLYKQKGAYRAAERWYRRAVDARPTDATYHIFLGALLADAGRLQEAEDVHRQATRCEEGCIDEAFLNLGLVLRAFGRYAEARACFVRALEIDPKYKHARKGLADIEQVMKVIRTG